MDAIAKLAAATIRLSETEREWLDAIRDAHEGGWNVETIAKAADVDEAEVRRIVEQASRSD